MEVLNDLIPVLSAFLIGEVIFFTIILIDWKVKGK